ncbi:protein tincar isoform X2 [Tribolium castaneum]|uniref:protein tincar isoform X2 n=1 Tax=Tribolium castaneum TaxID=7070 RepID=UPI00046C045D|nr:PREDICTED: protein tincar isoform X2 [Tribolium castaneum]|eukprot:XP_008198381.1 PREDICTED: protein tincar isoform X2 [Tribolium castaneum]
MSSSSRSNIYENNNDIKAKMAETPQPTPKPCAAKPRPGCCTCLHLNNLWSLWYGVFGTALQAYTAIKCVKRILGYSLLAWPENLPVPYLELNCSLGLTGAAILLLPLFLVATLFKIGNLANDGFKLGRQLSTCSREPANEILTNNGTCRLFRHGGPTAPFVHLVIAFCLLVPKLLMEARLIEAGFLSQDWIWRTDLDFMGLHKDRMVILSFMTPNNTTIAQVKRSATPSPITPLPFTSNSVVTNTVIKTLKDFIGHENHTNFEHKNIETGWGSSVSVEYMNLVIALMVYSIRYPALFWSTNKCLGTIFSFQLLINGLHTLLAYAGMSILYKVQIVGGWKTLPLLKHEPTTLFTFSKLSPFLLNPQVTLALYMMSTLLILSSSLVLYLYGHTRFNAFLNQERERKVIMLKEGSTNRWSYFTHCAALCVLVSVGICNAPLLHDYTVLYKGSLDETTLACIVGGILHLFFWIVIWLFLTIKQTWIFKLRVTVGRATVRQARSLKLVTDIDLMSSRVEDLSQQPLLIVGNGRTYNIAETSPKKAIMSVIQKATMSKKASNGSVSNQDDDEEQIYWLRPALVTPQSSPDEAKQLCWFKNKPKHKVTFNETTSTSVNRKNSGVRGRRLTAMDEDDGDYATLRELPLPQPVRRPENREDTVSEEGKLLACVQDERVTYASNNQDLIPPVDYEDPSPLLTPEPLYAQKTPASVIVHSHETQITTGQTPRCLRRADSGMPHDELTPRSDTLSTESSTSPPEPPGSNHSETSSGVHSNDSDHKTARRATSVVDLVQNREEIHWKSSSLQRNTSPPPSQAVILENPAESTVVIRRKVSRPVPADVVQGVGVKEEPFGRATNMRMTSFMEKTDLGGMQASSATLPHFPTQPMQNVYAHCSTMPLPQHGGIPNGQSLVAGNSCNVYPRQHTTLPTHHNGVKLFHPQNPYVTRFKCKQAEPIKTNIHEPIYTGVNKSGDMYHYNS